MRLIKSYVNRKMSFFDFFAWFLAMPLALWLRLEGSWSVIDYRSLLAFTLITACTFFVTGLLLALYSVRLFRVSFDELVTLAICSSFTGMLMFIFELTFDFLAVPRSLPIIATGTALLLQVSIRGLYKGYYQLLSSETDESSKTCLVYGAGIVGERVSREVLDSGSTLRLIGFIDDNKDKSLLRINGKRVLGGLRDLEQILSTVHIDYIFVAIASLNSMKLMELEKATKSRQIKLRIIPSLSEMVERDLFLTKMTDLSEEDLLSRPTRNYLLDNFEKFISKKRILVTGAAGSIGSEVVRQLSTFSDSEVFLLDRDESGLLEASQTISPQSNLSDKSIILADIRDTERIESILSSLKFDIVIHAAALKHLNLLERYPDEAFKTNFLGSKNLIDAALINNVPYFVNISTDKAADPISVLGKSKLMVENYLANNPKIWTGDKKYLSVRFGNVLGSKGSFLNTFRKQINLGGPVTVTDPNVTRYMMSISEAVQLVLISLVEGNNGDILILEMGEPKRILDVANRMIEKSGMPVQIQFVGLSPGEKLQEVLIAKNERFEKIENFPIMRICKEEDGKEFVRS
jgi:FlaA1/EpsC-like NDP-sugar epimerase